MPRENKYARYATVLKSHVISLVAEDLDITEERVGKIVESFLNILIEKFKKGETVSFSGFGTFHAVNVKGRIIKSPKTGEMIKVRERVVIKFRPGRGLQF